MMMSNHLGFSSISQIHPQMSYPVTMGPGIDMDAKKKGNNFRMVNDEDLRRLLMNNLGRPLSDVAQEVVESERTNKAEKSKQLLAMLWYVLPVATPASLVFTPR